MRGFIIICLLFSIGVTCVFSQENYRAGTLTQVNVNFSIPRGFKLNTKLESRQIFSEKQTGKEASKKFRYERTDLTLILTKKISADNSIGGGYMIRLEDGQFIHRLIQQFNSVRTFEIGTLAHRIVLDETFRSDKSPEIRLRYRLGLERALNGRSSDPGEFYIKFNNEYLGLFTTDNTDLEIRASAALGFKARDHNKIELGFEYRVNEFYTDTKAQQFWVTIAWFLSI
jgi:hypothetical protein